MLHLLPGADYKFMNAEGQNGGSQLGGTTRWKLLLHATITPETAVPGYQSGLNAPHLTVTADLAKKSLRMYQHIPFHVAARALANLPGGVQTNRDNVIQVEMAGYLDDSHPGNFNLQKAPDWYYVQLGALLRPIVDSLGIRNRAPIDWSPNGRMSFSTWDSWDGLCGHVHAPENNHWDPGAGFSGAFLLNSIYGNPNGAVVKPVVNVPTKFPVTAPPTFPYSPRHYFSVSSASPLCHSGQLSVVDRRWIRVFQQQLKNRGWNISVDGFFGPSTKGIVIQFQKEKGLVADGLVGPATWRAFWTAPK